MDFLHKRTADAIKRELRSIQDSYHHYWDPLAELLQNARDAIERGHDAAHETSKFIRVSVNAGKREIEVLDNGVGIPEDKILEVLAPGGGDKTARDKEVGEKGVGLTYAIFCGDEFEIESRTADGTHYAGTISGARAWLDDPEVTDPPKYVPRAKGDLKKSQDFIELEEHKFPLASFTRVRVSGIPPQTGTQDLFDLNVNQMKFLIQTRTAIGVTDPMFADEFVPGFHAFYEFRNLPGGPPATHAQLAVGYPPPHEYVEALSLSDVNAEFVTKTKETARRKYLKDKAVWGQRITSNGDEMIRVYGVMLPGNAQFEQLANGSLKLYENEGELQDGLDSLFRSGIFLGTKRMPTGVQIEPGAGGKYPAYYRRCFFLVESNKLRFDLGRKSMHWMPKKRLQHAVTDLFLQFEKLAPYQTEERVHATQKAVPKETKVEREARKKDEWNKYHNLVDLKLPQIYFQKVPALQEAGVAAIFHELLGAKILKNYRPLSTSYGAQYDLHCQYIDAEKSKRYDLIVEFKCSLESLVRDFEDGRKYLDDIHLLVAWSANAQKLKDAGFELDTKSDSRFEGVTHELSFPETAGIDPIPVILLEEKIRQLTAKKPT